MHSDIEKILISQDQIKTRIKELGQEITRDYKGKKIIAVCVLKGGVFFLTDLLREIDLDVRVEFMDVSSYGDSTESSGEIKILKDLETSIYGEDVLIIEDIVDTGKTLNHLKNNLKQRGPNSLEVVSFLSKPAREEVHVGVKYLGFNIEDYFVVGFGLDYAEKYRNLPYVGYLKKEIYE